MGSPPEEPKMSPWRERLRVIIFEADTRMGKAFDVALLVAIITSVLLVIIESMSEVRARFTWELRALEWLFTVLFTAEYVARLVCTPLPIRYARSFFGVVDLLAILPTYLSLLFPGAHSMMVIRGLRLLRIFRVFKLGRFLSEGNVLREAIWSSREKVIVFMGTVLILVTILGSAMYLIEGEEHGFKNIPVSIYWAIVTMTTVGYGDIAPQTAIGKLLAAGVMVLGYGIIAVPTGIVTAEIVQSVTSARKITTRTCTMCLTEGHDYDADYCKHCGAHLAKLVPPEV
jgi:voltage-gated potassium channel